MDWDIDAFGTDRWDSSELVGYQINSTWCGFSAKLSVGKLVNLEKQNIKPTAVINIVRLRILIELNFSYAQ